MKKKLKKRTFAGLIISVLAVAAALLAVLALRPHWLFVAGEYFGLNTRRITVAKISPELEKINIDALRADSRVNFDQSLMLVNSEHPLDDNDKPELAEYKKTGVIMNACAAESFSELSAAVMEKTGCKLLVMSSVRDAEEQEKLYNRDSSTAAAPGASEHQMGLGIDVYVKNFAGQSFVESEAGQLVNSESWKYGFIIRYPSYGKSSTGIQFEPWHIRYVGKPHAAIIYNDRLTLEKYIDSLEIGEWYSADGYLISRQVIGESVTMPKAFVSAVVSPDNTGCCIITVKQRKNRRAKAGRVLAVGEQQAECRD